MVGKRLQATHKRFELHFVHQHDDFIFSRTHRSHLPRHKVFAIEYNRKPAISRLLQAKDYRCKHSIGILGGFATII